MVFSAETGQLTWHLSWKNDAVATCRAHTYIKIATGRYVATSNLCMPYKECHQVIA